MFGPDVPRPDATALEPLARVSTASITTILRREFGITRSWIPLRPLASGSRFVGPALTLRSVPEREDIARLAYAAGTAFPGHPDDAIEAIRPGDVLVHDGMGLVDQGLFGDLLSLRVKMKGAAGLVTDMAVRDSVHIKAHGMPVFCRGVVSPGGRIYSVDYNVPIGCAGTLVIPGDVLVGDDDGVVVIPRAILGALTEAVVYHEEREEYLRLLLADGAELRGTYPVSPETDRRFREWRAQRSAGAAGAETRGTDV
jgi:regulator of RNase E activity RraA